jgi:hypothetical protein
LKREACSKNYFMVYILLILLCISLFLEGTVTTLPLVFICFVCLTIFIRTPAILLIAFFAGMLLDAFAIRAIGGTSIFLLTAVLLILLYQRKYEINSYPFVLIASFIGSLLFLIIFNYQNSFGLAVISALIAVILHGISRIAIQKASS